MPKSVTKAQLQAEVDRLKSRVENLQAQLRDSEKNMTPVEQQQLLAAVESSVDGLIAISAEGIVDCANPAFLEMVGAGQPEKVKKKPFLDMFSSPVLAQVLKEVLAGQRQQSHFGIPHTIALESGEVRNLELSFVPAKSVGAICICRDITDKYAVMQALQESEARFRILADASFDFIVIHRDGDILQVNRKLDQLDVDFTKRKIWEFIAPDHLQKVAKHIADGNEQLYEAEIILPGIGHIPVEVLSQNVTYDKKPARLAALRDIRERQQADEHLRYHKRIVESISDAVITTDMDFKIVSWNNAAEKIYGWTLEEVIGKSVREVLESVFLDDSRQKSGKKLQNEGSWRGRVIQRRKDSGELMILASLSLLYDLDGNATGMIAVNRNITEAEQFKKDLHRLQTRNEAILDALPDIVFVLDKDLTILDFSASEEHELLIAREKIIGTNAKEIFDPQMQRELREVAGVAMESGKLQIFEYSLVTAKSCLKHYEARLVPLGKRQLLAVVRDISEQKEAQDAVRISEDNYRSLFESSRDGIFVCNIDGSILQLNPAGRRILGIPADEPLATKDNLKSHFQDPLVYSELLEILYRNGHVDDHEATLETRAKTEVIARFAATLEKAEGGRPESVRGIFRDNTQQRRLEAQLLQAQKMEAIGTLAGGIAHDFNNILAAILGYTELLLTDVGGDSAMRRSLQEINHAGLRAKELVQQILTFSRRAEHQKRRLPLQLLVKESLRFLRATLPSTIGIVSDFADKDCTIIGDPVQIHRVIMNLITNSYHAIGDQTGKIHITLKKLSIESGKMDPSQAGGCREFVLLAISDTGVGIDPMTRERIFDPFYTTKPPGKGTGMGLAVVHGIVEAHDGFIEVESSPGEGSEFRIYFPRSDKNAPLQMQPDIQIPGGSGRILVVDDEPTLIAVCQQMLEKLGYEVKTALSSNEGLSIFQEEPDTYDLVITDQVMPEMTGVQLSGKIHHLRPDVPIVLISGYSESLDIDDLHKCGIVASYSKPLLFAEFAKMVNQVVLKRNSVHQK